MNEFTLEEILARIFLFFKKYLWLFVILGLLGLGIGFYKYKKSKTYYQAFIYGSTGLLNNARLSDFNINFLITDLKSVATHINDPQWVSKYFNLPNTQFKSLHISIEKNPFTRIPYPVKLYLKAYRAEDFEKFKQGLLYYFEHYSPLRTIHQRQLSLIDSLSYEKLREFLTFMAKDQQLEKSLLYSLSNYMEQTQRIKYNLQQPIFFFTSDFSKIQKVKSYKVISVYLIFALSLAFIISVFIEIWIAVKNYLKNQQK